MCRLVPIAIALLALACDDPRDVERQPIGCSYSSDLCRRADYDADCATTPADALWMLEFVDGRIADGTASEWAPIFDITDDGELDLADAIRVAELVDVCGP